MIILGRLEKDHDWNYGFSYSRDWKRDLCNSKARVLRIWILRFKKFPEIGETIPAAKFDGFYWEKEFDIPFTLKRARVFMTSFRYANTQDDASQAKKETIKI